MQMTAATAMVLVAVVIGLILTVTLWEILQWLIYR